MSNPVDFLILIRPVNSLMVGFAVVVGIAVTIPVEILSLPALLGFLTGFLISSYSMVVNDIYDREVDRVNNLNRPLANGRIETRTAVIFSVTLLSLGIISSVLISWNNFIIAAVFAFIAWIYNSWGKKQILLGNMMVAASVAIPYIYGGSAVERIGSQLLWFLALTSFLASTGREVIKTISDVEGDEFRDVKSIARIKGSKVAASVGTALFLSAVASSFLPIITNQVGMVYLILIFIPNSLFIYAALKVNRDYSKENAIKIKNLSLIGMIIGMFVFILGGIY
jgi:geranylgeranylglycerol-phosphate geranylgeranyltransferase